MKISVTKELGTKVVPELGKEHVPTMYAIEATEIRTKEELQEVIRQVQLVESQMTGGLGQFEIKEGSCSKRTPITVESGVRLYCLKSLLG